MLTIYHNPRCSKSRQALQLIEQATAQFTVIEYLKTPLTANDIRHILSLLKVDVLDIMRKGENEFKTQNLKSADESTLINAIINTPKLLERPIVVSNNNACIGRPPENVLALL